MADEQNDTIRYAEDKRTEPDVLPDMASRGLLKSRFDHLPLLKTLWVFRRAAF